LCAFERTPPFEPCCPRPVPTDAIEQRHAHRTRSNTPVMRTGWCGDNRGGRCVSRYYTRICRPDPPHPNFFSATSMADNHNTPASAGAACIRWRRRTCMPLFNGQHGMHRIFSPPHTRAEVAGGRRVGKPSLTVMKYLKANREVGEELRTLSRSTHASKSSLSCLSSSDW
jgi:hypothetical protein